MLSKNRIKEITSLRQKKDRYEKKLFFAEGERLIEDLLNSSINIVEIYYTKDCTLEISNPSIQYVEVSIDEMRKISKLSTPANAFAVVSMPDYNLNIQDYSNTLTLVLDDIQDPGNLGTIIRLADWFGVNTIICSNDTVDVYSPKVIQACMGSISRIKVIYKDLLEFFNEIQPQKLPIYGTFMEGNNIYSETLSQKGIIVMGNEGNGISKKIVKRIDHKIHIPDFAIYRERVESLNVAMATAIVLSEFRRRSYHKTSNYIQ